MGITYCVGVRPSSDAAPHPWMAACWLRKAGYELDLLCPGPPQQFQLATPFGEIRAKSLGSSQLSFQMGLWRELLRRRWLVSRAVYYLQGHLAAPAAALALLGVPRQRVIYHTQDYLEPSRHPHWELFERWLVRRVGSIITNEPNRARFMSSHYGLSEFPATVPSWLPRDWPRPEFDRSIRTRLLRMVGATVVHEPQLVMHQGAFAAVRCGEALVRALARLPVNYYLVFTAMPADSSAARELQQLAGSLHVSGRLIVLDRLSFDEMQRYTAACDIGVLLYPNDGVGNFYQAPGRLTQCIGCGLPVVTSDFPGLELLVLKYGLGAVCDSSSPDAIAQAICLLGSQAAEVRERNAERLRRLASDKLAYDRFGYIIEEAVRRAGATSRS